MDFDLQEDMVYGYKDGMGLIIGISAATRPSNTWAPRPRPS